MHTRKIVYLIIIFVCAMVFTSGFAAEAESKENTIKNTAADDILTKNTADVAAVDDKQAPNKDKTKIYHVYDDIDLVSKIDFQYAKPHIMIKTVTPLLSSDVDDETNVKDFNQAVQDIVTDESNKFKQKVAENADFQGKLPKKSISNKLFIDFDTAAIDSGKNHIISVRFSVQGEITGMAHPYHYHRVLNFDLDNNQALEITNLFDPDKNYIAVLSYYSNQVLSRRLPNKEMVAKGTAPDADNFKNWNIKPYGLLITFDEAQVAPYVDGAQTVLIPYTKLKDVISPASPIAGCLKHRRRCLSDNLLTGGFIDEV